MPLPTCECITGFSINQKLDAIYCATYTLSQGGGGGTGNVTAAGTLTTNQLVIGQGGTAVSTTTTGVGVLNFLGTPSSSNLAAAVTDETGSGALVFATSPVLVTPNIGAATATTFMASGAVTLSAAGAASVSPQILTGAILTGGTGTTNFPHFFIQPAGATATTTWSTSGTAVGVNAATGFGGNFIDFRVAGTQILTISSAGTISLSGGAIMGWINRGGLNAPADGIILLRNAANTDFNRLQFGGTTSAFPSLKRSSTSIQIRSADDSADASLTAATLTLSGNLIIPKTVTPAGTTGAQTIDKISGSVNFAAGATSLVVTNALVTVNSIIHLTIATNDLSAQGLRYTPGAGSFTIRFLTAPAGETRVDFLVTN